jgi:hypothetical protein
MKWRVFIPTVVALAIGIPVPGETAGPIGSLASDAPIRADFVSEGVTIENRYAVDYCASSSVGEDNGVFDPGETLTVWFWLRNDTGSPLSKVSVTLSSLSPTLIVHSVAIRYPDLPSGEVGVSSKPFIVTIYSERVAEPCALLVSAAEGSWEIPHSFRACGFFSSPLRKEFEIWPIRDWQYYGNPNYGGWKSNEEWGHPNTTGGTPYNTSYGQCAEGVAWPSGSSLWQELRTRPVGFIGMEGTWVIRYNSKFTGAFGGGIAQVEMSQDGGFSWSVIGTKSDDDPADGLYTRHEFEVEWGSDVIFFRFRLSSGSHGASWQIDALTVWMVGGPAGPLPEMCVPCSAPPPCDTPADAQLISPQDGITGLGTEVMLSWDPADHADAYEVFVGPRMGELTLMGTTTDTSFLLFVLAEGTRYEWMISAVNECDFNHSRVWAFTTAGGEDDGGHVRPVSPP